VDPTLKNAYTGPEREKTLARIEVHFGDKENAVAARQHLLNIPYVPPVATTGLTADRSRLGNLRGDPRFEKLCQEQAK
jgi:hypothetical protein